MAKKGKYQRVPEKKPLGWKKWILIVLAVLLALLLGAAVLGTLYYNDLLDYVSRAERQDQELSDQELQDILGFVPETMADSDSDDDDPWDDYLTAGNGSDKSGKIVNIMLIGQAKREGEESKLSDTMILVTLNKETKTLTLTSFLRDTYVKLPNYKNHNCGMQRMNVAYNLGWHWAGDLGGMEMLDMLILENFGVKVDHNVEINFGSFKKIVDLMGGVTLDLTEDEAKYLNAAKYSFDTTFTAGTNTLGGEAALEYARMRKSNNADNDFNRTARQRKVITVLLKQCMKMSLNEIDGLLKAVLPMVLTDMTDEEITNLMMEFLPLLSGLKIESVQIPAEGTYHGSMVQIGGVDAAVLKCDVEANKKILLEICEADNLQ